MKKHEWTGGPTESGGKGFISLSMFGQSVHCSEIYNCAYSLWLGKRKDNGRWILVYGGGTKGFTFDTREEAEQALTTLEALGEW